jgi:acetyl-CoA C-acetyltransferase
MTNGAWIVSACRSPIGRFLGQLSTFSAVNLGTKCVAEAVRRAGLDPGEIQEVIMGNVLGAGLGQNPARQCALGAEIPTAVAAMTINKVCGSGLKSVTLAAQSIQVGDNDVVVAGGMESMSNAPHLMPNLRRGQRMGEPRIIDSMVHDGLWDVYNDYHMGCTGEVVAEKYGVTRQDQDAYASESHRRAVQATLEGKFEEEILSLNAPLKKGGTVRIDKDEGPRSDSTTESLAKLRPVFAKDGTVTAGNASQLSDGAAAVTVMSDRAVERLGVTPLARVVASATTGVDPEMVMMSPLSAVMKVRQRAGWSEDEVDLYEINEAFSVQAVALCREIPLDVERVNLHGGAVALGHPIGASGTRILVTLLNTLRTVGGKKGIASLCLGGGNGVAMAIELI